ncbi:Acyl-CoA dehydrogenase related to the alkylation response protein AidB [Mycobacterium numidiamassiliense]|uniref:Acyl-CoA dehydrogenase related to the alkylation response protein AidB n=1 Tax=Mycobacterium numidiamassiliense TaxID=1841861 RepID=A0A2U3PCF7_9MYCO|nr:acyl-CoA dehydrogenase family protein [Mycobacterium numidiamassiliense]SPM41421.1 Acyl-CoA dehydrogenase related to the alkylation response protein AidB [Mycobacterium numidiamassiliense]
MASVDSPEMTLFASTTQAFLDREVPLSRVRELHEVSTSFEPGWWRRAAELGWTALLVPERLGGGSVSGNGVDDLALVARYMGRSVAPGPLHPVSAVLTALVEAATSDAVGGDPDHGSTIASLVDGTAIASWAVYEPGRAWDPLGAEVTATATESGYRIDGVKDRVEAGCECDTLLVMARTVDGLRQLLVSGDAPGVSRAQEPSIDLVKHYARVTFDAVEVPATAVVGTAAQTPAIIERQSQIAQILQCAEVVGILDAVLDFTIQWALDRTSFGRPLASYQALKHCFADMKMWQEACRATTNAAVAAVAERSPAAARAASIAKSYVGERAGVILQQCVQLHGGIGVTWEHDLHVYLRRVALYRSLYGTPEEHNLRVYAAEEQQREGSGSGNG